MAKNVNSHLLQLDLSSRYTELCNVWVTHDYFKDGLFASAELIPDEETLYELRKLNLQFRVDKKGILLGYRMDDMRNNVAHLTKPVKLTFWVRVLDNYFLNYSDLPFEFSNEIYYFSNRVEGKQDTGKKGLSQKAFVTAEDRIATGSHQMRYAYAQPLTDAHVEVRDDFDAVAFDAQQQGEHEFINLNLTQEPAGRYRVFINGALASTFYLVPNSVGKVFGVIELFLDKKDHSIYSFYDANGGVIRQNYNLRVKNRAIKWRYLLIENTPSPVHSDWQILDARRGRNNDAVGFTSPKEVPLEGGGKAVEVMSTHPIPLKEAQEEKFRLRTKKGKNKVDSILDLPCASARSSFKTNFENKSEVFSELLVYL